MREVSNVKSACLPKLVFINLNRKVSVRAAVILIGRGSAAIARFISLMRKNASADRRRLATDLGRGSFIPRVRLTMLHVAMAALLPVVPAAATVPEWIEGNRARILREYVELLAIPNVASDTVNIRRNADHLVTMMRARGLSPRLLPAPGDKGPPAIYGEWRIPGSRQTLVLYAHYDGQPVTARDWKSTAPFTPVLRTARLDRAGRTIPLPGLADAIDPDWRLYARSASDDKAGVMAILTAVDALRAGGVTPAFNLKIFLDGEEEAGSPNIRAILQANRALLKSDGWLIVDGPAHANGATQAVLGVRGIVSADITIHGPTRPLHSGHYGNWAPNPAMMLSQLLASMKDADGKVLIAGFYDDIVPLTAAERAAVLAVPNADAEQKADLGLARTEGQGRSLAELIQQTSLNVDGIRSADVGDAARNVVPATATATIDMRLVKGDDPRHQIARVKAHIERQGYLVLDRAPTMAERLRHPRIATLVSEDGYAAARTGLDHPLARRLIAGAGAAGPLVVLPSTGGSLPLSVIEQALGAPTTTLSPWNYDNSQHAEDENLRLGNLWAGIAAVASVMSVPTR